MTVAEAVAKIKSLQEAALVQVANVAMAHVMPFVPIDTGRLRQSGHVEANGGDVDIVFGDSSSRAKAYAAYQYSEAEQHITDGDSLGRMISVMPPSVTKRVSRRVRLQRYAAAYRYAVDNNLLTRFPGGVRWFRIILEDSTIQKRMAMVYANYLKNSNSQAAA